MRPGFVPLPSDKPRGLADRDPRTSPLGMRAVTSGSCKQQEECRGWISSLGREMGVLKCKSCTIEAHHLVGTQEDVHE